MTLIKQEDAIDELRRLIPYKKYHKGEWVHLLDKREVFKALNALPSAEAKPTVIRSRTLMPTKDFKEWAKRIRETNPDAVVIPCDAEVVSAEAVEVVRCVKCKHYSVEGETTHFGWCGYWNKPTDEMRFCSDGERREDGEE